MAPCCAEGERLRAAADAIAAAGDAADDAYAAHRATHGGDAR